MTFPTCNITGLPITTEAIYFEPCMDVVCLAYYNKWTVQSPALNNCPICLGQIANIFSEDFTERANRQKKIDKLSVEEIRDKEAALVNSPAINNPINTLVYPYGVVFVSALALLVLFRR